MIAQHTPGPWEFDKGLDGYGFNTLYNRELRVGVLAPNGQNGPDCAIVWMGEESSDADLLLIAAAPDLLAAAVALEKAETVNANCPECKGEGVPELCDACFPHFDRARLLRRAAIARATGAA